MTRLRYLQTNFSRGELNPLLQGRVDSSAYRDGAKEAENWAPLMSGGIMRRPGTTYIATLAGEAVLAPFIFSQHESYVFAFSNTKVEIFYNDALVQTISSAPWTTAQLRQLRWAQFGDVMFVVHEDWMVRKITRTGLNTFALSTYAFEEDDAAENKFQPYFKFADESNKITPSATTGSINLTLDSAYWNANHVGDIVRIGYGDPNVWYECEITGFTSTTIVVATVRKTLPGTTATSNWEEPAFSVNNGYPRTVALHEERLVFGGSPGRPAGLWLSKTGAFFNFDLGTGLDDESIDTSVGTDLINQIHSVVSNRSLQIFTDSGEFYTATDINDPITPGNIAIRRQTQYGSNDSQPVILDGATLFAQGNGKMIREFLFDDLQNAYTSNPIAVLSDHIISSPVDTASISGGVSRPEQYAFFINDDGTIALFHSIRSEGVAGWFPWTTRTGDEWYSITGSLAGVLGSPRGASVYVTTMRSVNSSTVYYLEKFGGDDSVSLDCSKSASSGTKTFTGFTHLANETVNVISGNYHLGTYTVTAGGDITITDDGVSSITAGFNYIPTLETLPPEIQLSQGTWSGLPKRIVRCIANIESALSMTVNGTDLIIRQAGDDFSNPPTAQTGPKEFWLQGWSRDPTITITQVDPLPLKIRNLVIEVAI